MKQPIPASKVAERIRRAAQAYVSVCWASGSTPHHFGEHFAALQQFILKLPTCESLNEGDVQALVMGAMLRRGPSGMLGGGLLPNGDIESQTNALVAAIQSIPRTYWLRISMPSFKPWAPFDFEISERVRLTCARPQVGYEPAGLPGFGSPPKIPGDGVELAIKATGFASGALDSPALADALSVAKQCAYLFTTTGPMRQGRMSFGLTGATIQASDEPQGEWILLPMHVNSLFARLEQNPEGSTALSDALAGGAVDPDECDRDMKTRLATTVRFFSLAEREGHDRIAAAIEWLQDSLMGQDQTIGYLSACIGLESIFGEEEEERMDQMTKRLQDRYAFLLGTSREDRKKLMAEFGAVLKTRGRLVHARAKRLAGRERGQLATVQGMLNRAIHKELSLFLS